LLVELGVEIRNARLAGGLSLKTVAAAARISAAELSRVERGLAPWLDVVTSARICAVVGLDLSVRAHPGGDPLRDVAHLRLFSLVRDRLGPGLAVRTEVPIGDGRDQRAWDVTIDDRRASAAIELKSRLTDAQALARRIVLKCRDGGIDRVILVLSDTTANRNAVAGAREMLRSLLPLDAAEVLHELAAGRVPRAGGIVFVRAPRDGTGRARGSRTT
jgi:transcriptional regulator with XRE-family HTH domain